MTPYWHASDPHWNDISTYIHQAPPAAAVSVCVSELRTPMTVVIGFTHLLSRALVESFGGHALAQSMIAYGTVLTQALITDELLDFGRLLITRFPALHADDVWEQEPPLRPWDMPLDQAILEITHRIHDVVLHIRIALQHLQRSYANLLEPDMQALIPLIDARLNHVLVVVDFLIAETLVERIRNLVGKST